MSGASHQEWALKPQCQHVSEEDLPGRWTHQLDISIQRVRRESPGPAFWKRIRLKCRRSAAWILSCAKVYWTSKKIEVWRSVPLLKNKNLNFWASNSIQDRKLTPILRNASFFRLSLQDSPSTRYAETSRRLRNNHGSEKYAMQFL